MENNRYREEEKEELEETVPSDEQEEVAEEIEETNEVEQINEVEEKPIKEKKKIKELKEQIAKLELELANVKNEMLLDRAELENFKRRTNDERIKDRKYANQTLLSDMINVIDIFDKAVSSNTEDELLKKYLLGFKMINMQLQQVMSDYGVQKIKDLGEKFNPNIHQAVETIEVEGVEEGQVVEVIMQGYMYKDRVLRPSMVKVSK